MLMLPRQQWEAEQTIKASSGGQQQRQPNTSRRGQKDWELPLFLYHKSLDLFIDVFGQSWFHLIKAAMSTLETGSAQG